MKCSIFLAKFRQSRQGETALIDCAQGDYLDEEGERNARPVLLGSDKS